MNSLKTERDSYSQVLALQFAESDIKQIIKQSVLKKEAFKITNEKIKNIIKNTVEKINIDELKKKIEDSLLLYASKIYKKLKLDLVFVDLSILPAVAVIASTASANKKNDAFKDIKKKLPNIASVNIKIEDFGNISYDIEDFSNISYDNAYSTAQPLNKFMADYMKDVSKAFEELYTSSAKDAYSSRVSLRNVVEMTVRNNNQQDNINKLIEDNIRLVWTSTHGNCSERCEPWQGRLYSLDGTSGEIDGIKYIPLETATDIYTTTKSGSTYKNGIISGFNCRHFLIPYKKGNAPIHISADEIARDREINNTQREFERTIRKHKQLAEGLKDINPIEAKKHKELAVYLNKKYSGYCKDNNVASYPSRTKIFDNEEMRDYTFSKSFIQKTVLTKKETNDIINANNALNNKSVRVWYVNEANSIHENIDQSLPKLEKSKIAFYMRNDIKTKARDEMLDNDIKNILDIYFKPKTFEEMLVYKMDQKKLTMEEAIEDIYKTAVTTNKSVNKELGIDE